MDDLTRIAKSVRFELDLRPNKTFQLVIPPNEMSKQKQVFDGTWTQKGDKGTFLVHRVNGKTIAKKDEPARMTINGDAKSMLVDFPPSTQIGKATLVRIERKGAK